MSSTCQLFQKKAFSRLFWVQFLGAFNDNVFKNALVVMMAAMVLSAIFAIVLLQLGFATGDIFGALALIAFALSLGIAIKYSKHMFRLVASLIIRTIYRVRYGQLELIPEKGAGIIICNHQSMVDALVVAAVTPRPVYFVMDHNFYKPLLRPMFRLLNVIPIAQAKEDPMRKEKAFEEVEKRLARGQLVCIFPEGMLTRDGDMNPFRSGVERILNANPVPVIPFAIDGLFGSWFSFEKGKPLSGMPKPKRRKITVKIADALPPETPKQQMQQVVGEMLSPSEGP